jgi:hypothetical protein
MTDELFTDPGEGHDEWVDVRMTDPDAGEWDVDMVVVGGTVEYVDLRIRPELLGDFVECLADDVDDDRVETLASRLADGTGDATDRDDATDASE